MSKMRLVLHSNTKSIPKLELMAVIFGVEIAYNLKYDLSEASCPVDIAEVQISADSTVAMNWLAAKATKFLKIEKKVRLLKTY